MKKLFLLLLVLAMFMSGLVHGTAATANQSSPPAPRLLEVKDASPSSLTLRWQAPRGVTIDTYRVYRNGTLLASVSTTEYTDRTIRAPQMYTYTVRARVSNGTMSRSSNSVRVDTRQLVATTTDREPPAAPYPLITTANTASSISLSWKAATDHVGVHQYELYMNGILLARTTRTVFQVTGLMPDTAYMFNVRAVDLAGNRSAPSYDLRALTAVESTQPFQVLEPRTGMSYGDRLTVRVNATSTQVARVEVHYAAPEQSFSATPTASQTRLNTSTAKPGHASSSLFLLSLAHPNDQAKLRVVARSANGAELFSQTINQIGKVNVSVDMAAYGKQLRDGSTILKNKAGDVLGTRFALWSKHATRAQVWIYGYGDNASGQPYKILELTKQPNIVLDGYLWVTDALNDVGMVYGNGLLYGYRVWGPNFVYDVDWRPGTLEGFVADVDAAGNRYNPNKLLVDPYARTINKDPDMRTGFFHSGTTGRALDNGGLAPKSVVYDTDTFSWDNQSRPQIPLKDTIVYEVHVRGYTQDVTSGVKHRGTYRGFTERLDHIRELGVTAIELLPIHETVNDDMSARNRNFWGYMSINYFAPDRRYAADQSAVGPVNEFKQFVKTMHAAGKEVWLDVVYNHTAEDGHAKNDRDKAAILSLRGIDNQVYYSLSADRKGFTDNTGCCGANVNAVSPKAQQLVIDSLRYWVDEMRVDGFRFDLASILGNRMEHGGFAYSKTGLLRRIQEEFPNVKLIAEPWAIGNDTYQVGNYPGPLKPGENAWGEWQDKFRQTARYALRGDVGHISDLVKRVAGSSDLYQDDGRKPYHSINYVVSHDGYTLNDLFSYNSKDGWDSDGNDATRRTLIRNAMALMAVSAGTPMILGGDEMRRTQYGNANAYNQDNWISWYDWSWKKTHRGIFEFTKGMLKLRNDHPVFRRADFFTGKDKSGDGLPDIQWHGANYRTPDWSNTSRVLAWRLDGSRAETGAPANDNDFYIAFNNGPTEVTFQLPPNRSGKRWYRVVDTAPWAETNRAINNNIEKPGNEDRMTDGSWTSLTATSFTGNSTYLYKVNPRSIVIFMER